VSGHAKARYDASQAYAKRQANQPPVRTSRTTGNSCTFWGGVKSGIEGAAVGGALGALQGSVAPGSGTVAGAITGAGYGAFSGSMAHTLGCIW
jgi:outer membrane lipoprotein SlyB